jgi:hypothetical protein
VTEIELALELDEASIKGQTAGFPSKTGKRSSGVSKVYTWESFPFGKVKVTSYKNDKARVFDDWKASNCWSQVHSLVFFSPSADIRPKP